MPTNPMLSAEHMGIVDAHKYGATRDYTTLAAALGAIGSSKRMLLLPFSGNGIWTINSAVTIPANVCLLIAPGVIWAGTGNVTFLGQLVAYQINWFQGSGTFTGPFGVVTFGAVRVDALGVGVDTPAATIHVKGSTAGPAGVRIEESVANAQASITFVSNGTLRATHGLIGTQDLALSLTNSARYVITGGNVGLGTLPTVQLELSTGGAQKATGTTWSNPSDPRLKEAIEPFDVGLALLQQIAPISYCLNGRGGMVADGVRHVGYDAAALQTVAPEMVRTYRGLLDPEGEETDILSFQGGDMLIAALLNAVKELATRVAALEGGAALRSAPVRPETDKAEAPPPRRARRAS